MHPSSFDESNGMLNPPAGVSPEEVQALSVCWMVVDNQPVVVSCWRPTQEELDEINKTGRVWLMSWGGMPPSCVEGINPISGKVP